MEIAEREAEFKLYNSMKAIKTHEDDNDFELELISAPYSVKTWTEYIRHKIDQKQYTAANLVAERALNSLPGSYKLWAIYLRHLVTQCSLKSIEDPLFEQTNGAFEKSLSFLTKMPVIWAIYLRLLMTQRLVAKFIKVFGRAQRALPVTQHEVVWPVCLEFVRIKGVPAEIGCRMFERYSQIQPDCLEERVKFLKRVHRLDDAAVVLAQIVNDENYIPKKKKSKEKIWNDLCNLMCKNPKEVKSLNVDAIIRRGIDRYEMEAGNLWASLADYYLRILQFEKARDVYEEGLKAVKSARDFEYIFNTYSQFCEIMIRSRLGEGEPEKSLGDFDLSADDADLLMARYENLLERRPLLLNSVLLRQEPHNVGYWLRRAALFKKKGQAVRVLETYAAALKTIDVKRVRGKPHVLWIQMARFYEDNSKDLANVRKTYERAVKYPFASTNQLATIWCEWAETEIRHKNYEKALEVVKRATTLPFKRAFVPGADLGESFSASDRVHRSVRLWALYADLEEAMGTFETVCSVYDTMFELKIITVPLIQNYFSFLEKNEFFERSYRALERGLSLFKHPQSLPLWEVYVAKFVERYGDEKVERIRELFERILKEVPAESAKKFYLKYAEYEEKHGTPRNAMEVYEKMCDAMKGKDKFDMFLVYLSRASELFGALRIREIFEKALTVLPDESLPPMCCKFAALEIKLGEVDRTRAIFQYGAKTADIRIFSEFWNEFEKFEADYGNIETFADMNRIKRSVATSFTNLITPPPPTAMADDDERINET